MERSADLEGSSSVVAIRLMDCSPETVEQLCQSSVSFQFPLRIHFETESFLVPPEVVDKFPPQLNFEDVTDIYQELISRKSGFRIVLVGRQLTDALKSTLVAVKDHSSDSYFICEDSRIRQRVSEKLIGELFASGTYQLAPIKPLVFYASLDEAIASGTNV